MCDIFSMTLVFLMYNPARPKIRMVLPKVKGMESASAQGHAIIKTDVKTKMALWVSPFQNQNRNPIIEMIMMTMVNRCPILSDKVFSESTGLS